LEVIRFHSPDPDMICLGGDIRCSSALVTAVNYLLILSTKP